MTDMPTTSSIVYGAFGLAQIGSIIYLVKVLVAPLAKTVESCVKSVEILFDGRNQHEKRIVKIETIHELKGCDQPEKDRLRAEG